MPTYQYICEDCQTEFEVKATLEEKKKSSDKFNCPACSSKKTKQIISAPNFMGPGSGCSGGCSGCGGGCS